MAMPHQVRLAITYDGTVPEKVSESSAKGTESKTTPTPGYNYKVQSGDCLWDLAYQAYGSGNKYTTIYDANKETIEAKAKAYGFSSSDNGERIWPDTVLYMPETGTGTAKKTTSKKVSSKDANPKLGSKIAAQATAFSYTDVASGQSDSVSIKMHDIGMEWIGSLMPKKGASLGAKLKLINWNKAEKEEKFNCGTFVLDDISFSGRPLTCVLGGVSVPADDSFKTEKRTKTWQDTTIKEIASEIAKRAGVSLHYDAGTVKIAEQEQSKQTDSAFLYSLCEKYGLAMKAYNKKIVIFDIVKYEKKDAVLTLKESDLLPGWTYNTTIDGTYTGVTLNYTDPDSDETISVTIGTGGRMYELDSQASSRYDAELQASAKANAANREIEKMTVKIRANINIVASHCIKIEGLGNADGKYYIDKIVHSVGNGYTMQLTMHKVQAPIGEQASDAGAGTKTSSVPTPGHNYKVQSGDCLWDLAYTAYGSGAKYTAIYNANKNVIEEKAKANGFSNSDGGSMIWPGTVLYIPEV